MPVELTDEDRRMLEGDGGKSRALAMRLIVKTAEVMGAQELLDVDGAHIDGCLYHGRAGLDFARRLLEGDARVRVPTTLNVSSLDLLHPELVRLDPSTTAEARELMDAYVAMGCRPTWTCAPYQLAGRPSFGQHVAWAESNAIVFANSVLGARTNRYGDFIDICCAITGRAPAAGLHLNEGRRAGIAFVIEDVPTALLETEAGCAAVGHVVGLGSGTSVPAIVGLPLGIGEDHLKAIGAAGASSGAVAMFHAVGITPEAPDLLTATGGRRVQEISIAAADLRAARDQLGSASPGDRIGAVSVGTPHLSVEGFARLAALVGDEHFSVPVYVNTGRDVLATAERAGTAQPIVAAGATIVTDTCTYITPIVREIEGPVLTDSGKWAWYAPGNLGLDVAFGTLTECVRSARTGSLERDEGLWGDG